MINDMTGYIQHPDFDFINSVMTACRAWLLSNDGFGPTSQITGDGAVDVAERMFSACHGGRPALLVPSATYGMRGVLIAVGVAEGARVCCPDYDWPSSYAAVQSLGAVPVLVPVDSKTLTLDPEALKKVDLRKISAVIATHIHGIPADIPAIRKAAGSDIPIIEDCCQAFGSRFDGNSVGTMGDAAVFSFGPNKTIYTGEGGMIIVKNWALYEAVLRETAHPLRQMISGAGDNINYANFSVRPHPVSAIMLIDALNKFNRDNSVQEFTRLATELAEDENFILIGADSRRENTSKHVPVMARDRFGVSSQKYNFVPSGAFDLNCMSQTQQPVYLVNNEEDI